MIPTATAGQCPKALCAQTIKGQDPKASSTA